MSCWQCEVDAATQKVAGRDVCDACANSPEFLGNIPHRERRLGRRNGSQWAKWAGVTFRNGPSVDLQWSKFRNGPSEFGRHDLVTWLVAMPHDRYISQGDR